MNIGETLARARGEAGLTVTQVSARTRIRETVIRAIERDDFTMCGGNFYARGHIRGIARTIGLDPEPLIHAYDETHGGAPQAVPATQAFEPSTPVGFTERRAPNWSAAMAVALVLVLAYGVIRVVGDDSKPVGTAGAQVEAPSPATSPQPDSQPSASPSPSPRTKVTVKIKAKRASWVNARNEKGKQLFSGIIQADTSMEWTAKKRIRLLIGNPGGITLIVNGKNLGSPDANGRVTRRSFGLGEPKKD